MYVTGRERKIIDRLLDLENQVTLKQLAEELDISTRTVHRDLKGIEDLLAERDLSLMKESGGVLLVKGSVDKKNALRLELSKQASVDYTPEERHVLILSKLLETREPVKLVAIANDLGVTVATISHDLDKIEDHLKDFQLKLVRKRGYGVEVIGEESGIREAISQLIMTHMNELDFFSMVRQNIQGGNQAVEDSLSAQMLDIVNKETLALIEYHVDELRNDLSYPLADSAYIALVVHLALAIERMQQGEKIHIDDTQLEKLRSTKEYSFAEGLIAQLAGEFQLSIPEAETGYITMHLMGAKARYNRDSLLEESSMSIAFKAKQLIAKVSRRVGMDFNKYDRLMNDLVVHLKPSVYRLQHNMEIENSFTDQMEEDYPVLFEEVQKSIQEVFPELQFPREETAFVVMHFASALLNMEGVAGIHVLVVCSSGIGTAKILAAKLQKKFNEIEQIEHHSLFDLKGMDISQYDLIVSTIPLADVESYVQVSPVLPQKDIHKIEHAIRRVRVTKQLKKPVETQPNENKESLQVIKDKVRAYERYASNIGKVLDHLLVTNIGAAHVESALDEAVHLLKENGTVIAVNPIVNHLLEREKAGGLGIPDTRLALYHARSSSIEQPSFSVHILREPLKVLGMDGEEMPIKTMLLMIAPEAPSQEGLETLSLISSLIIEDAECTTILESENEENILHYIANKLYTFLKSKE
ncbi:BglG family transcription antiterminator [Halobacillus sp. HZG1]|uniref:BglG family transcription antiterminator n=1 Tax=Halobacillus sp. HZG1 TaxID=3111769 RepID=UPI002DBA6D84|nr:BglG family transcription antiterminator [Halobacillus sp. HZG1]MEC3885636.1 BglG family transcription antiterminator [Halobacillus sp. HZG1]